MPSTIVRNQNKTGLVLLESRIEVSADGFLQIPARFLAPSSGLRPDDFALDSVWPIKTLPVGMPSIQGGPFLSNRTIKKENGITYIEALYVTAANPVKIVETSSDSVGRFSGYEPPVQTGLTFTETAALLSFDYIARAVTFAYAIVGDNKFEEKKPSGGIGARFNVVAAGNTARIGIRVAQVLTRQVEKVGSVQRVSITATPTLVQTGETAQRVALYSASQSFSI